MHIRDELLWLRNGYYRLNWVLPYTGPKTNWWAKTYKIRNGRERAQAAGVVCPLDRRRAAGVRAFFLRLHDLFLLPSPSLISSAAVRRPPPSPSSSLLLTRRAEVFFDESGAAWLLVGTLPYLAFNILPACFLHVYLGFYIASELVVSKLLANDPSYIWYVFLA